jgi:hypothetical protein
MAEAIINLQALLVKSYLLDALLINRKAFPTGYHGAQVLLFLAVTDIGQRCTGKRVKPRTSSVRGVDDHMASGASARLLLNNRNPSSHDRVASVSIALRRCHRISTKGTPRG